MSAPEDGRRSGHRAPRRSSRTPTRGDRGGRGEDRRVPPRRSRTPAQRGEDRRAPPRNPRQDPRRHYVGGGRDRRQADSRQRSPGPARRPLHRRSESLPADSRPRSRSAVARRRPAGGVRGPPARYENGRRDSGRYGDERSLRLRPPPQRRGSPRRSSRRSRSRSRSRPRRSRSSRSKSSNSSRSGSRSSKSRSKSNSKKEDKTPKSAAKAPQGVEEVLGSDEEANKKDGKAAEPATPAVPPKPKEPEPDYSMHSVKELKEFLTAIGVSFAGATEKSDLEKLLRRARAQAAASENMFIPTATWQPVPDGVSLPRGLEVKFDITTGVNLARLLPGKNVEAEASLESLASLLVS